MVSEKIDMKTIEIPILVVGGGNGGVAAGISASRSGTETLIVEKSPWLGGMYTAAGVSAFDGNWGNFGTGIFREIRSKITDYYGGAEAVETGWVSKQCFEPSVAEGILENLVDREEKLTVLRGWSLSDVKVDSDRIEKVHFSGNENRLEVKPEIVIEATEYGQVLELTDHTYLYGRESKKRTGEKDAPEEKDNMTQDATYVAILKQSREKGPPPPPKGEKLWEDFKGCCKPACENQAEHKHPLHSWEDFLSYGRLPNNKYMINWPFHGNDFSKDLVDTNRNERNRLIQKAKKKTKSFVSFIQHELPGADLRLAKDEFPTPDNLPLKPYIRESRRGKGLYLMKETDVVPDKGQTRPELARDGVAIGDYYLDHHHVEEIDSKEPLENYPENAPFQIPYRSLVSGEIENLIFAEKSISVTHIVNGCTRLQPIVTAIGEVAGLAGAMSLNKRAVPANVSHRLLQSRLIKRGVAVFPYEDISPDSDYFKPAQRLALLGGLLVRNDSLKFSPEKSLSEATLKKSLKVLDDRPELQSFLKSLAKKNRNKGEIALKLDKKIDFAKTGL